MFFHAIFKSKFFSGLSAMDLSFLDLNWRDLRIEGKQMILLVDMLKRSRGTFIIDGYEAINFEPANEDIFRIVLRVFEVSGEGSYCYQLHEDTGKWVNLGMLRYRFEWGKYVFIQSWSLCGIKIPGLKEIVPLKDIFSGCLGEKLDGVAFVGKSGLNGKNVMLRLDTEERLERYDQEQKCEMFNTETDEWEFWGMLVKKLPPKPRFKI